MMFTCVHPLGFTQGERLVDQGHPTFDVQMLRHMIDRYGSGLISSVPRLKSLDKERIMGANAARLLNIKV